MSEPTQAPRRTRNTLTDAERNKYIGKAYAMLLSGHDRGDVSAVLRDKLHLSPSTASGYAGQAFALFSRFLSERYDVKTDTLKGAMPNLEEAMKVLTGGVKLDAEDPFARFFDDMPAVNTRSLVAEADELPNGVERPFVPSEAEAAEGEAETEAQGEAAASEAEGGEVDTSAFDKASKASEPKKDKKRR